MYWIVSSDCFSYDSVYCWVFAFIIKCVRVIKLFVDDSSVHFMHDIYIYIYMHINIYRLVRGSFCEIFGINFNNFFITTEKSNFMTHIKLKTIIDSYNIQKIKPYWCLFCNFWKNINNCFRHNLSYKNNICSN